MRFERGVNAQSVIAECERFMVRATSRRGLADLAQSVGGCPDGASITSATARISKPDKILAALGTPTQTAEGWRAGTQAHGADPSDDLARV